jgi:ferredoxin-type protein NapH
MAKNALVNGKKGFRFPIWILRVTSVTLITSVIVSAAACRSGYGRLCVLESPLLGITCPLGYLGAVLASKNLLPYLLPSVGVAVLLIVLLGRFFCAWVCPASLAQILKSKVHFKGFRTRKTNENIIYHGEAAPKGKLGFSLFSGKPDEKSGALPGLAVLGGALASSAIFGFPVFCLICPVGLTFGTIFAAIRLFNGGQPGFELFLFPLILILELIVLKSWCHSLCPLGALHRLLGRFSLFFRPKVEREACLVSQGINCRACEKVCPEGVNLGKLEENVKPAGCTKCMECYTKCPTNAIKIKLFSFRTRV